MKRSDYRKNLSFILSKHQSHLLKVTNLLKCFGKQTNGWYTYDIKHSTNQTEKDESLAKAILQKKTEHVTSIWPHKQQEKYRKWRNNKIFSYSLTPWLTQIEKSGVLFSYDCCKKLSQTQLFSGLKSKCRQGHTHSGGSRDNPLLASLSFWWPLAFLWPHDSHLCSLSNLLLPLSYMNTYGAHLDNSE